MIHIARTPLHLARIVKGQRSLQNLTQEQLSTRAGLKQATISVFEADAEHAKLETLYKLLGALGLEMVIRRRGARIRRRPAAR
jgi:HTH-type transcriptional regulator/antitoxin HipB